MDNGGQEGNELKRGVSVLPRQLPNHKEKRKEVTQIIIPQFYQTHKGEKIKMTPQRIQLKRTKGWRLPPNTVVVSRPTKWGNPHSVAEFGRELAVSLYRDYILHKINTCKDTDINQLRGKNVACWCSLDELCHADVLLELANPKDNN